ncbi:MAG: hypothetical protein WAP23_00665 [Candidatus Spechtbacterales bacterium]
MNGGRLQKRGRGGGGRSDSDESSDSKRCGGNSATPERKTEAAPATLLVESRATQKSFLFLLEEKIRRAQNQKSRENFFVGRAGFRHGGGAASLGVFLKVGSREVYNYSTT